MKNIDQIKAGGGYMLHEDRNWQSLAEMFGAIERAQKLQVLTDENLYLERRLADMVSNNRVLQSMRSRKPSFKF